MKVFMAVDTFDTYTIFVCIKHICILDECIIYMHQTTLKSGRYALLLVLMYVCIWVCYACMCTHAHPFDSLCTRY